MTINLFNNNNNNKKWANVTSGKAQRGPENKKKKTYIGCGRKFRAENKLRFAKDTKSNIKAFFGYVHSKRKKNSCSATQ